jgi:hypothetical protein
MVEAVLFVNLNMIFFQDSSEDSSYEESDMAHIITNTEHVTGDYFSLGGTYTGTINCCWIATPIAAPS